MILFDRWDNQICTLQCLSAIHSEELNGEDILTIETYTELVKGYRIVWQDKRGIWHEHIVDSFEHSHDGTGKPTVIAKCLNSISETFGDWISEIAPTNATAQSALTSVLTSSRWAVGTVQVTGSKSTRIYHSSVRAGIQTILEIWGGELQTDITVSGDKITARKVSLLNQRGFDTGKRFTYTKDLESIKRTVASDDVFTALCGYGKGEEVGEGYGRRINFASLNGGKEYIEDNELKEIWGRPDGTGKAHSFGVVVFEDCEDPAELLQLTRDVFPSFKEPKVSYECSVIDLERAGFEHEGSGIGDVVAIIDREFPTEIRLQGRVTKYEQDLLDDSETIVTVGNIVDNLASQMSEQQAALNSLQNRSSNWDVAAYTPTAYLEQVMDALNENFTAAGNYYHQSFGNGIIFATVPMDENGKPTQTGGSAMQLTGEGFRIANSRKSDGTWNWRTFGTGDGFVADHITAGTITGGANYWNLGTGEMFFKKGRIQNEDNSSYWNLETGDVKFSGAEMQGVFRNRYTNPDTGRTREVALTTGELTFKEAGSNSSIVRFHVRLANELSEEEHLQIICQEGIWLITNDLKIKRNSGGYVSGMTGSIPYMNPSGTVRYIHVEKGLVTSYNQSS